MRPLRLTTALLAFALVPLLPAGAHSHPEGRYECVGKGSTVVAMIVFSAMGYRVMTLTPDGKRDAKGIHGTGGYRYDPPRLLPLDGPLAFSFRVVGTVSSDEHRIDWKGGDGTLVSCSR